MKNVRILFATLTALLICASPLGAQKTATWKGGTPGRPAEWNCSTNWKEGRVPDEFSRVVIPDVSASTFHTPVLNEGAVEIWSLQILSGATLQIGKYARLTASEQGYTFIAAGEGIVRQSILSDSLYFMAK